MRLSLLVLVLVAVLRCSAPCAFPQELVYSNAVVSFGLTNVPIGDAVADRWSGMDDERGAQRQRTELERLIGRHVMERNGGTKKERVEQRATEA